MRARLATVGILFFLTVSVRAQYTGDFQTNVISGVTNNSTYYFVGDYFSFDVLLIQNRGVLLDSYGGLGDSFFGSHGNSALVTGSGSIWSNTANFLVGDGCSRNSLVIRNGGQVLNGGGYVGHNDYGECSSNTVLVSDAGSMWRNDGGLEIGTSGTSWNSLIISNGGQLLDQSASVGNADNSSNNSVLVTGSGSVWSNQSSVYVGDSRAGNCLTISNGGCMFADSLAVGRLILAGGSLTANALIANNGSSSSVEFDGGVLTTGGTVVSNGAVFAVGDGVQAATFHLMGGVHAFADGLWIRTNGVLQGCGEIHGNTLVEGKVLADCGGTLFFTDVITNNGTIQLLGGTYLDCYGRLVNNGTIIATNGTLQYYSDLVNNGTIVGAVQDMRDIWSTASSGKWEVGGNWSLGAPTNGSSCVVSNSGSKTVTIDAVTASAHRETLAIDSLTLQGANGATNTLLLSNSGNGTPLRTQHELIVGGGGKLVISNGAVEVGALVGRSLTIDGDVSMSAAALTITNGPTLIGSTGVGKMTVSNSTVLSGEMHVGYADGSSGMLTVAGSNSVLNDNGTFVMGDSGSSNSFVIRDGSQVVSGLSYVGYAVGSTGNSVLITGTGSVWNAGISGSYYFLYIGYEGAGNSLVVSNGGKLVSGACCPEGATAAVGGDVSSRNNSVLVTGSGSVWSNVIGLIVGNGSPGNTVVVNDGGAVVSAYAEMDGESNSVVVSGAGSVWECETWGSVDIRGGGSSLMISNGGQVADIQSGLGAWDDGNNRAVITGPGSVWNNSGGDLEIGLSSSGNTLVVSNGGQLVSSGGLVGFNSDGSSNAVVVTGWGSVWNNGGNDLRIGGSGDSDSSCVGNGMMISDGGQVVNNDCTLGYSADCADNAVRVMSGGTWQNASLYVGYQGSSNSLTVSGGSVLATNLVIGFNSTTCDNMVQLDSGNIIVTNATHDAVLEVRSGTFVFNGGVLQVDRLVITNACARFFHNGGTLLYSQRVLDPNLDANGDGIPNGWEQAYGLDPLDPKVANMDADGDGMSNLQEYLAGTDPTNSASVFRITAITREGNDMRVMWSMGAGKTNALQIALGGAGTGYTNAFTDVFVVTNTVGSTTNYLDLGGGTSSTPRFYRVRLVQ